MDGFTWPMAAVVIAGFLTLWRVAVLGLRPAPAAQDNSEPAQVIKYGDGDAPLGVPRAFSIVRTRDNEFLSFGPADGGTPQYLVPVRDIYWITTELGKVTFSAMGGRYEITGRLAESFQKFLADSGTISTQVV